jgi:hypothetical protein
MVVLAEGKYVVMLEDNGARLHASRYGEPWRNLTGDNLVLALFRKVRELEKEAAEPAVEILYDSQMPHSEKWSEFYPCPACKTEEALEWLRYKFCPNCGVAVKYL